MLGADDAATRFHRDHAVRFSHFLYRAVPEKRDAIFAAGLATPARYLMGWKVACRGWQYMTVLASV
jgi:hypothetical protein